MIEIVRHLFGRCDRCGRRLTTEKIKVTKPGSIFSKTLCPRCFAREG